MEPPIVDKGWAWIYVFASFMISIIYDGFLFSIGIFHGNLYRYFNSSNAATSLVESILLGMDYIAGPFASCLVNRFGCRKVSVTGSLIATSGILLSLVMPRIEYLYLTMGLFCGFGVGLLDFSSVFILGIHFHEHRATAMGISFSGSGFGSLLLAPLMGWLNLYYGFWKGTMLIAAGLMLNCTVFSMLYSDFGYSPGTVSSESFADVLQGGVVTPIGSTETQTTVKTLPSKVSVKEATQTDSHDTEIELVEVQPLQTSSRSLLYEEQSRCSRFAHMVRNIIDLSVFSNYAYIVFNLGNFIFCLGIRIPFVYVPDRAVELGLATPEHASFLLAIAGVCNTLGRLIFGFWADRTTITRLHIFNAILMVNGLSHFATVFINKYYQMAIYSCVFGLTFGGLVCLTPVVLVDLVGIRRFNTAYGLIGLTSGIAILVGTPMAGMIHDRTHSYEYGFYVCGGIVLASCLVLCSIPIVQKKCARH
ncbi:hypothetical protein JTE90_005033 [Oedothorax gibbosus]|uniref:Major facilitator superfamily (MFS) profile domain-containing protein n=1 Tax=Oedothorax gibbosus TaxID=931172 RepID=A0AAV6VAN4_9ARAC|nr:hypothetical protein JTE90_005033 [Oedothorax gibbosus]